MFLKKIIYSVLAVCTLTMAAAWRFTPTFSKNEKFAKYKGERPILESLPSSKELIDQQVRLVYNENQLESSGLSFDTFRKAYIGYINLKTLGKVPNSSSILSIADFDLSSKAKRLWILNLSTRELLFNTWVSHGRGSGSEMATAFSNITNSHQSSLGFYVTGEVYYGKHGRSLRLDGMDQGFNNNARSRAIVIHGADYVSENTIRNLNRLGLSHGCPAVPSSLSDSIIDLVKNKSVLYIHSNTVDYYSRFLDEDLVAKTFLVSYLDENHESDYERM